MTKKEYLTTSFVFILFILIGCYKLTNSSLWYDETIEYWYSKIMIGTLPNNIYNGELSNMYQRILTTYQPPLYNFLMFFWLKLGDGEWWFRFSGVILGLICLIGIYKSVYLVSKNTVFSSMSVITTSFTFRFIYYVQECAEYILLLTMLSWTMYYALLILYDTNKKNIAQLILFSILSMYSQYGAIFPVASILIIIYIYIY